MTWQSFKQKYIWKDAATVQREKQLSGVVPMKASDKFIKYSLIWLVSITAFNVIVWLLGGWLTWYLMLTIPLNFVLLAMVIIAYLMKSSR